MTESITSMYFSFRSGDYQNWNIKLLVRRYQSLQPNGDAVTSLRGLQFNTTDQTIKFKVMFSSQMMMVSMTIRIHHPKGMFSLGNMDDSQVEKQGS